MLLLREIIDFYCFFCKTSKVQKAIVFYAEHEGYYPYFEGLIKKLISEYGQILCYVTSDPHDPILRKSESQIKTFYLNKLLPFFMAFVNCKVFLMTLTDLDRYHLKRSVNPVHYIYVFHALVSTHMSYRYGAFDHYDSILCVGPHQIREIRKREELNGLQAKRLVEDGYYRLERIYKAYQEYLSKRAESEKNGTVSKKNGTVLIAPSWGVHNVLESCGLGLAGILLEANFKVIVRPHPETMRYSPELIDSFASRFGQNEDFILERSIATDDSLLEADILISDCSGVAFEYAFGTERPVLFLDVPIKIKNKRYKELGIEPLEISLRTEIGIVVSPQEIENVPNIISEMMSQKTLYKGRLSQLREENVYNFGHSSKIGAQYIMDVTRETNKV